MLAKRPLLAFGRILHCIKSLFHEWLFRARSCEAPGETGQSSPYPSAGSSLPAGSPGQSSNFSSHRYLCHGKRFPDGSKSSDRVTEEASRRNSGFLALLGVFSRHGGCGASVVDCVKPCWNRHCRLQSGAAPGTVLGFRTAPTCRFRVTASQALAHRQEGGRGLASDGCAEPSRELR